MAVGIICLALIAVVAVIVGLLLAIRRSSRQVVRLKSETVRSAARAEAADKQAERLAGVTGEAVQTASGAVDVARQIDQVHAKVDVLIERTEPQDETGVPRRGRHARPDLYAVAAEEGKTA